MTQSAEDQSLVALFQDLDTAAVSDALDRLGIQGQAYGIRPLQDCSKTVVGPAFTVSYVPAAKPPGTVGDFIDEVAPGDVIVLDNNGREDCTVWGDIMTQYAGLRGIAGTVIDGVCRDVQKAIAEHYPIFSRGRFMRTGKDRVEIGSVGGPVSIGRTRVEARDLVVADASGVVIVPRRSAETVARIAQEIEAAEDTIRQLIQAGASLSDARAAAGYHHLQSRADDR